MPLGTVVNGSLSHFFVHSESNLGLRPDGTGPLFAFVLPSGSQESLGASHAEVDMFRGTCSVHSKSLRNREGLIFIFVTSIYLAVVPK